MKGTDCCGGGCRWCWHRGQARETSTRKRAARRNRCAAAAAAPAHGETPVRRCHRITLRPAAAGKCSGWDPSFTPSCPACQHSARSLWRSWLALCHYAQFLTAGAMEAYTVQLSACTCRSTGLVCPTGHVCSRLCWVAETQPESWDLAQHASSHRECRVALSCSNGKSDIMRFDVLKQARSGNILQHLAAELRRAEASGGMERLMSSGGNAPRGATYPAAGHGVRRRQSDPDFLAQLAGGQQQPQSRRAICHKPHTRSHQMRITYEPNTDLHRAAPLVVHSKYVPRCPDLASTHGMALLR